MGQTAASTSGNSRVETETAPTNIQQVDARHVIAHGISEAEPPQVPSSTTNGVTVAKPLKGSTFISLDDDTDDSPSVCKRSVTNNSFAFAKIVQDLSELDKRRQQNLEEATERIRRFHRDFAEATVSKMNVYHHPRRGNRHIIVIDYAIPLDLVADLYQSLLADRFRRTEFARPDTKQYKHHLVEYNPNELRKYAVSQIVTALVKLCFPAEPLEMYRVYTNAILFGDVAFMHRDSDSDDHITALLYPNLEPEWRAEFGGETVFYDESREIIDAVEPRPGRLCLFTGSILHKGSPPGRLVYESRFTTAFKFSPVEHEHAGGSKHSLQKASEGDDSDPEPQ